MGKAIEIIRDEHSASALRELAARTHDGSVVRRLLGIALILEGHPREEAARLSGMDRQTLRDWAHLYNADGVAGLSSRCSPGRPPALIRRRWPRTRILLRADFGFTREPLMAWCEANRADFVFGLAGNERLEKAIIPELISATIESIRTGQTARCFKDFSYATLSTWSRERWVIGKAEVTGGEANPRFIVTSLKRSEAGARHLYEMIYCARGDMENRIKECQLDLFADRTSTATMQANQLRLWFASMAYVLLCALRRIGLAHTQFAAATCGTIRLKLLKIGALVRFSVRRIKVAMASACPWQDAFELAHARLRNAIA